jgi:hypothetical protein
MTSRLFKFWLDSGANAFSTRKGLVTLEELGFSDEEWDAMSEEEQFEFMKELIFANADWGFVEVPTDGG